MPDTKQFSTRLPRKVTDRVKAVVDRSNPKVTKTAVALYCLELGLPVLERKYGVERDGHPVRGQ